MDVNKPAITWKRLVKQLSECTPEDVARQKAAFARMEKEWADKAPAQGRVLTKCWQCRLGATDVAGDGEGNFGAKTFANYHADAEDQETVLALRNWTIANRFGFCLFGKSGNGKTHLAKAFLIEHSTDEFRGMFKTAADFFDTLRKGFDDQVAAMNYFCEPGILVIDDLGAEKSTDWTREKILTLVDKRLNHRKITLLTLNLTESEIADDYGARFTDRLFESIIFLELKGKSFRRDIYRKNQLLAKNDTQRGDKPAKQQYWDR